MLWRLNMFFFFFFFIYEKCFASKLQLFDLDAAE